MHGIFGLFVCEQEECVPVYVNVCLVAKTAFIYSLIQRFRIFATIYVRALSRQRMCVCVCVCVCVYVRCIRHTIKCLYCCTFMNVERVSLLHHYYYCYSVSLFFFIFSLLISFYCSCRAIRGKTHTM